MSEARLTVCPACSGRYRGGLKRCPFDGATLVTADDELGGVTLGGRFTVAAQLGVGSIGAVYRGRDAERGGEVALKVLHGDLAREATHRDRFRRETRAIMRVHHPSVVDVLAMSPADEPRPWFAMRLYEGPTLANTIVRAPLPPTEARRLAVAIASALAVAHAVGVVHRDLKGGNVLLHGDDVRGERVPVLLDFGLASVQGEPGLTETGELIGSPHTMSPEQIRGEPPCPAMDLYALGCLWFQMVSGRPPFLGSASAVLDAHLAESPPSLASLGAPIDGADASLIGALLSKEHAPRAHAFATLVAGEAARAR